MVKYKVLTNNMKLVRVKYEDEYDTEITVGKKENQLTVPCINIIRHNDIVSTKEQINIPLEYLTECKEIMEIIKEVEKSGKGRK